MKCIHTNRDYMPLFVLYLNAGFKFIMLDLKFVHYSNFLPVSNPGDFF